MSKAALSSDQVEPSYGGRITGDSKNLSYFQSYSLLLDQLRVVTNTASKNKIFISVNDNFTINDFRKLLVEVKDNLEQYKIILLHKIKSSQK